MSASPLSAISPQRKLLLGSGLALLIATFLPWYKVSIMGISASQSGWHQLGTLAWVVLILVLVWEGLRIAGVAPVNDKQGTLISAVGGLVVLAIGVIFIIQRLADGYLGFGFFLGAVALAVFGFAAVTLFKASGGKEALVAMQQEAAAKQRAAGEEPPAPPAV